MHSKTSSKINNRGKIRLEDKASKTVILNVTTGTTGSSNFVEWKKEKYESAVADKNRAAPLLIGKIPKYKVPDPPELLELPCSL